MAAPLFTITIPIHGTCLYVAKALQSALEQQDDFYRVVLLRDDDEDDFHLPQVAANPNVVYLRHSVTGIALNWNRCLDSASGTLCTILHQDDRLEPTYIRTIRRLYDAFPEASAYFVNARVIGPSGTRRFSFPDALKTFLIPRHEPIILKGEQGLISLLRGNWLFCPTVCYNLTRHFPWRFNSRYNMVLDLDMYVQILVSGGTIIGTHERHYAYRRHDSQYTSRLERDLARFQEEIAYYHSLKGEMRQRNYRLATKTVSWHWVLRFHAILKALAFLSHGDIRGGIHLARTAFL